MTKIDVRNQVSLPLSKIFALCVKGIQYRLFRSAITVAIVALAVAFLMMMLSTSYIDRQVGRDLQVRSATRRLVEDWTAKLTVPLNGQTLAARLAVAEPGAPAWREFAQWGGLDDAQLKLLQSVARRQQAYQHYLDLLKPGERSALIGSRQGGEVFDSLVDPKHVDEFFAKTKNIHGHLPVDGGLGPKESLLQFEKDYQQTAGARQKTLDAQARAVAALAKEMGTSSVLGLFQRADQRTLDMLAQSGFIGDQAVFKTMSTEAGLAMDAATLAGLLRRDNVRKSVAKRLDQVMSDVRGEAVFEIGSGKGGAAWLKSVADEPASSVPGEEPFALSPERIYEVSNAWLAQRKLADVQAGMSERDQDTSGLLGFSPMTVWLIIISFVVCAVGVANAMLMSVTERFREIATMKCLGALDSFIMISFVLESVLQGVAGGIVGVFLGLLLGTLRSLWGFGFLALTNLPGVMLLACGGSCLVAGMFLAALAAVYPAWVAARLAPMEAMRIE
jgi:putative ABC transport system permease protein